VNITPQDVGVRNGDLHALVQSWLFAVFAEISNTLNNLSYALFLAGIYQSEKVFEPAAHRPDRTG
jgi:hypothetical protein